MKSKVLVYVEGPSDKAALNALLGALIEQKNAEGVSISFFEAPSADRKDSVLTKVPLKAANILINDPNTIVVALPDLYPPNKSFPHRTCSDLAQGITQLFQAAMRAKGHGDDPRYSNRFKVFCLKHDLEALILAAEQSLSRQFGVRIPVSWKIPVEDQNHNHPPKRIVENIYRAHGKRYKDTVDAPLILGASDYAEISARCQQCFKPFVEFLLELSGE